MGGIGVNSSNADGLYSPGGTDSAKADTSRHHGGGGKRKHHHKHGHANHKDKKSSGEKGSKSG